jgi:hypothetical protein
MDVEEGKERQKHDMSEEADIGLMSVNRGGRSVCGRVMF